MAEKEELADELAALISKIQRDCGKEKHVFRGMNISKDEDGRPIQVSSHIYRRYKKELIFKANFQPVDIERDIVERARTHFSPSVSNAEILTDLRHFGADTTLIDFSYSLSVALFFACNGEPNKDGLLIAFQVDDRDVLADIDYDERNTEIALLRSARTELSRARAEFQSSIFVHAPKGNIPKGCYKPFRVSKRLKETCLKYLRKFHNIHEATIFNDLIGFISNGENLQTATVHFYLGLKAQKRDDNAIAVKHYNKAIEMRPGFTMAYHNRGYAKAKLGHYKDAITDYNEAIRLNPVYALFYYNRGRSEGGLGLFKKAIASYNNATILKSDYTKAYIRKGVMKAKIGKKGKARADLMRAIELAIKQDNRALNQMAQRELRQLND